MANFALTDAYVSIDSNVVDSDGASLSMPYSADSLDATGFGDSSRVRIGGLKDWSLQFDGHQDFAASGLDSILFPLVGTVVAVEVRPTSSAVSSSNPKFTGNVLVQAYNPFGNSVGELAGFGCTMEAAGDLTRAES